MTDVSHDPLDRYRNRHERRTDRRPPEPDPEPELQDVLDALDDPDCRAMLRELDHPRSAGDVSAACDVPSSTAYRKLDLLSDAGLVEERTELREGFRQVTVFVRAFESVCVTRDDDGFTVELDPRDETPDERLSEMWERVKREV